MAGLSHLHIHISLFNLLFKPPVKQQLVSPKSIGFLSKEVGFCSTNTLMWDNIYALFLLPIQTKLYTSCKAEGYTDSENSSP